MHLIADDSSHCETQCSPSLCRAVITLAAQILSPSFCFLHFCTFFFFFFLLPISLFPLQSINLLLFLLPSGSVSWGLVLTVFTLPCSTRNQGNYYPNPGRVSLQIMTIDLCVYYVFSGTLFTRITRVCSSVQLNTAIQWWFPPPVLNKHSHVFLFICARLFIMSHVATELHGCLFACLFMGGIKIQY